MSIEIKTKTNIEKVVELAQHAGLIMMTAAATVGMFELPEHPAGRAALAPSAALAPAYATEQTEGSTLRRERDEAGPHYISYSVSQRTAGRTGWV